MPSYPTSVKSFTTKNTGDVVQAAHINDLQDEVAAIEAGIRNGTAPINASGSTLTSLSVTGNSTLAAVQGGASTFTTLQVTGNSSFANRPIFTPPDVAKVYRESTWTLASSGFSTVAWNHQDILTNSSMHSTTLNPERLSPQTTGVYRVTAQISPTVPSAGNYQRVTIKDSSNSVIGSVTSDTGRTQVERRLQVTAYKRFDAVGGYVVCEVEAEGASTSSLSSGVGISWFSMEKL